MNDQGRILLAKCLKILKFEREKILDILTRVLIQCSLIKVFFKQIIRVAKDVNIISQYLAFKIKVVKGINIILK